MTGSANTRKRQRCVPVRWLSALLGMGLLMFGGPLPADDDETRLTIREPWSAIFAGREAVFHAVLSRVDQPAGHLAWSLSTENRTLARREVAAPEKADQPVEIRFVAPELRQGVVLDAVLTVAWIPTERPAGAVTVTKRLRIFADNPFADWSETLRRLPIHLFDPAGETAEVFEELGLPFKVVPGTHVLAGLDGGVVIIGEGLSLREYRALPETLVRLAARGVPVVLLAPAEGLFPLPADDDGGLPVPQAIAFRRSDVIKELDKRLDKYAWPPRDTTVRSTLALKADRGRVVLDVTDDEQSGWPWVELRFPPKRGRLVVTGFGIIEHWDDTPVPRYLLAALLNSFEPPGPP